MEDSSSLTYRYIAKEITVMVLLGLLIPVAGGSRGQLELFTRILIHITILIILVTWLAYRTVQRRRLPGTALDLPIVFLLLVALVSSVFSTDARLSLEGLVLLPIYGLCFYLMVDLLRDGWPGDLFVRALIAATGITCVLAVREAAAWYLQWYQIGGSAHLIPAARFRISTTAGGPNQLAGYINLVLPLALVESMRVRQRASRIALTGWIMLALFVELLTFSRGGLLGLASSVTVASLLAGVSVRGRARLAPVTARIRSSQRLLGVMACGMALAAMLAGLAGYWLISLPSRAGANAARLGYWEASLAMMLEHPLTGAGYFAFAIQYPRFVSIPPMPTTSKAHNAILTVGAELGSLGVLSVCSLAAAFIIRLRKVWSRSNGHEQLLIAGCVGSLTGVLFHGLVDDFVHLPAFALLLALVSALALEAGSYPAGTASLQSWCQRRRPLAATAIVPLLGLTAILFWTNRAYFHLSQAAELASQAQWEPAARALARAVELDPHFAFYHFQLGLAYGNLASSDPKSYLEAAIREYEAGLAIESNYSLNHANLAGLYWQAGLRAKALWALREAIELAPRASQYYLQLGSYHEQMGLYDEAEQEYERALQLESGLAQDTFWKRTSMRRSFAAEWKLGSMDKASQLCSTCNSTLSYEHLRLGLQAVQDGRYDEARYHYLVFSLLGNDTEGHLLLGRLARQQGDMETARTEYEACIARVLKPDGYGPFVYRRLGLYEDTLPQLPELGFTSARAQCYMELGRLYEQTGEVDRARRAYEIIIEHDPTFLPALERLEWLYPSRDVT
jgi:putative inorganic carbon (HCO3(-)) transporter